MKWFFLKFEFEDFFNKLILLEVFFFGDEKALLKELDEKELLLPVLFTLLLFDDELLIFKF
jgi:hypothetical protein